MALVACPECGNEVSDSAAACPKCGHPLAPVAPESGLAVRGALTASLIAAAAIIIGSFMPWISMRSLFGTISASGMEGDGVLTLAAGVLIAVVAGIALGRGEAFRMTGVLIGVLAIISGLISLNVYLNLVEVVDLGESGVVSSIGGGLWLVLLGSAVGVGASVAVYTASGSDPMSTQKSSVTGLAVGAVVVVLLVVALSVIASQSSGNEVRETFSEIASGLDP